MKIVNFIDVSIDLEILASKLKGETYSFAFFAASFSYDGESEFCIENLTTLNNLFSFIETDRKINGTLSQIEFEEAFGLTKEALSYKEDPRTGYLDSDYLDANLNLKVQQFLAVLHKHGINNQSDTYLFLANRGSLFKSSLPWGFCLIFVNSETKKGLFVFADPIM